MSRVYIVVANREKGGYNIINEISLEVHSHDFNLKRAQQTALDLSRKAAKRGGTKAEEYRHVKDD